MAEISIPLSRLASEPVPPCTCADSVAESEIVYYYKGQVVEEHTDTAQCLDCHRMYAFISGEWK